MKKKKILYRFHNFIYVHTHIWLPSEFTSVNSFNSFLKYMYFRFLNIFIVGSNRNSTLFLTFNQIAGNESFRIFLEFSWIVTSTSSILIG